MKLRELKGSRCEFFTVEKVSIYEMELPGHVR